MQRRHERQTKKKVCVVGGLCQLMLHSHQRILWSFITCSETKAEHTRGVFTPLLLASVACVRDHKAR